MPSEKAQCPPSYYFAFLRCKQFTMKVRVASLKPAATARDLLGTKSERRRSAENKESGGENWSRSYGEFRRRKEYCKGN